MLNGCTFLWPGTNVKLSSNFWQNKTAGIVVGVTPYPIQGATYIENGSFALTPYTKHNNFNDTRIFSYIKPDSGLSDFIKKFNFSEIFNIRSVFSSELTKRGMQVSLIESDALNQLLQNIQTDAKDEALRTLREQTNADFLILFKVVLCGLIEKDTVLPPYIIRMKRPYYAAFQVDGYLINLHNGNVEWMFFHNSTHKLLVSVEEWNQPPDYPGVAKALRDIISLTTKELTESFFN